MRKLTRAFLSIFRKRKSENRFVLYKIIDSTKNQNYLLQRVNEKAVFFSHITEIVFDKEILRALHPIQACFIGIEYSKLIEKFPLVITKNKASNEINDKEFERRYGRYSIVYQKRNGDICYTDELLQEEYAMDPRDIALSKEIIQEFDASQAFYIGILAGLKIDKPRKELNQCDSSSLYLRRVK